MGVLWIVLGGVVTLILTAILSEEVLVPWRRWQPRRRRRRLLVLTTCWATFIGVVAVVGLSASDHPEEGNSSTLPIAPNVINSELTFLSGENLSWSGEADQSTTMAEIPFRVTLPFDGYSYKVECDQQARVIRSRQGYISRYVGQGDASDVAAILSDSFATIGDVGTVTVREASGYAYAGFETEMPDGLTFVAEVSSIQPANTASQYYFLTIETALSVSDCSRLPSVLLSESNLSDSGAPKPVGYTYWVLIDECAPIVNNGNIVGCDDIAPAFKLQFGVATPASEVAAWFRTNPEWYETTSDTNVLTFERPSRDDGQLSRATVQRAIETTTNTESSFVQIGRGG